MTDKEKSRVRRLYALLFCMLAFIWGNSMLSGDVSSRFSENADGILERLFAFFGLQRDMDTGVLRKVAHFVEHMALGLVCCLLLRYRLGRSIACLLLAGLSVALIDETIQLFVPGRGSQIADVWIDFAGYGTGCVSVALGRRIGLRLRAERSGG